MDVQRIVTRNTVGSQQTVFGITTFPPAPGTTFTVTSMPRKLSISSRAPASRMQCHQQVRGIADGD
jgi:hypothetical protein